jgi:hypothetical protein
MKKIYLTAMICISLLICSNRMQAQGTETKLNQVELIKQFTGNWKGEAGKDTTALWEIKFNGTAMECNFKYVTKNNTFMEGKQLWEYDKKVDKFILAPTTDGMNAGSLNLWFTSKNKCIIIQSSDISNPENAPFKLDTEFKSPDMFIQKTIVNNNIVKTGAYNRLKN